MKEICKSVSRYGEKADMRFLSRKWKIRGEEIVVCDIGRENDSTESFTCDMHGDENAKTRFEM